MIYLGADHRGYYLKEKIKKWLDDWGKPFEDLGNLQYDPADDYPDFGLKVAVKVAQDPDSWGILSCGSGIGMNMVANKTQGVRAALVFDEQRARQARQDTNANVLVLAGDVLNESQAQQIIKAFLETEFSNEEKHRRRIEKIPNATA